MLSMLNLMPERQVELNLVMIAAPDPAALQVPCISKVGHDPLGSTLRDPDGKRNIAQARLRVAGDAKQHVGVVGEECPVLGLLGAAGHYRPLFREKRRLNFGSREYHSLQPT